MKFHSILALLLIVIMDLNNAGALIIANGTRVTGNEFKWVVSILQFDPRQLRGSWESDTIKLFVCTGSIISELHILTAAHCTGDSEAGLVVSAGSPSADCTDTHRVRKIRKHPSYGSDFLSIQQSCGQPTTLQISDVAVLTLETPLVYGERIGAIPLPTREFDYSPQHSLCKIAGWGSISKKEHATHSSWATMKVERYDQFEACQIRNRLICAQNHDTGARVVSGDSGAGLMCDGAVIGITAFGPNRRDLPAIFISVFHFLPFIHNAMEQDETPPTSPLTPSRNCSRQERARPCICL